MYSAYLRSMWALTYRDIRFIFSEIVQRMIDGLIIVFMQTLAIGQFLPLMGMPTPMIAPLYIGTITQIIFSAAYGVAFRHVSDLHKDRFINYQIALPAPKMWVFAQITFSMMIEIAFISVPLIFFGSFFLGHLFSLHNAQWILVVPLYILTLIFYALLFIYLAFSSDYAWFIDNVWARRLAPLFLLGCSYFTWWQVYNFNYIFAYLFLLNPVTYIHEGLRSTMLGKEGFLPLWVCVTAILFYCLILILLIAHAIKKRLDPV